LALWSYEDWAANVTDMWVIRLAAPDQQGGAARARRPQFARNRRAGRSITAFDLREDSAPSRMEILGHVIPLRDGSLDERGHYHAGPTTLRESFRIIRERRNEDGSYRYGRVLIHFFGARADERETAKAIRDAVPVFKANGVYPLFLLFEAELCAELYGMLQRAVEAANGQLGPGVNNAKNRLIEGRMSGVPDRLRRELESSAKRALTRSTSEQRRKGTSLAEVLEDLFASLSQRHQSGTLSFHLSAHGFGARFAADFLDHAVGLSGIPVIDSLTLTAPLLTIDEFQERVAPHVVHRLDGRANPRARRDHLEINRIRLAVLDEECQREDRADPGYGGSLPELWASAGALAMRWLGQTPPDTDESAETREPRLRLLALPQYARLLSQPDIDLRVE
jgi:hypothetical protein